MATQKFDKKAYQKMLEELSIKQQGVREGIEAGKQLTIRGGGGGNVPGEDGPYRKPPPSETPPYPPKELANFLAPGGSGKTLSEEAYWDGLQTIMETTEAGSDEQNKRLNILWHQFQDQVKKPQNGLKIDQKVAMSPADVPLGDGMIYEAKTQMQKNLKQKYDMMLQNGFIDEVEYQKQMDRLFGRKKKK